MATCKGGCILLICGSRDLRDNPIADVLISSVFDEHLPKEFVHGGAIGIDRMAAEQARRRAVPTNVYLPRAYAPSPSEKTGNVFHDSGIKARNVAMVHRAECVVRISSTTTTTYGSGWTADYAEAVGKNVTRMEVDTGPRPEAKGRF